MKKKSIIISVFSVLFIGISIYLINFRTVTVSFEARIGAGIAPIKVKIGDTISAPDAPDTNEYTFLGWYLDGEKFDFNTPIKKNITLEAKWEKVE